MFIGSIVWVIVGVRVRVSTAVYLAVRTLELSTQIDLVDTVMATSPAHPLISTSHDHR